jgi:hypothetical protein
MRLEVIRRFKKSGIACPLDNENVIDPNHSLNDVSEDAFRSLLLTIVGRPGFIGNYTQNNCSGFQDNYVPGTDNIELLIHHLHNNTIGGSPDARFLQTQWKQPKSVSTNIGLKQFFSDYARAHKQFFKTEVLDFAIANNDKEGNRREVLQRWVDLIMRECLQTNSDNISKWVFQIHQALSTLETVYGLFAGKRTLDSIPMGAGSLEGWEILERSDCFPGSQRFDKTKHKEAVVYMSDVMTEEFCKMILDSMMDLDRNELQSMFLYVDDEYGVPVLKNSINGMVVDCVDIEHWLCKLHLYIKVHTPGYEATEHPQNSSPHCRPFITHDARLCIKQDRHLFHMTVLAQGVFQRWAGRGKEYSEVKQLPPEVFLVPEEDERFLHAISDAIETLEG